MGPLRSSVSRPLGLAVVTTLVLGIVGIAMVIAYAVGPEDETDEPEDVPQVAATNRAMAAMLIDRIDRDPTSQGTNYALEDYPAGSIGAIVNFDGITLSGLATRDVGAFDRNRCDRPDSVMDGCREESLADGSTLRVRWQEIEPEEDPGIVYLEVRRDDRVVVLSMTGPEVTGDPESIENLPVDLDALIDVTADPAFGMRTSQRYVDQGERIDDWKRYP